MYLPPSLISQKLPFSHKKVSRSLTHRLQTHRQHRCRGATYPCKSRTIPNLNRARKLCTFALITQTTSQPLVVPNLVDPNQRKFLSLGSTENGIASMSAVDKALRNAFGLSMDGLMSRCQDDKRTSLSPHYNSLRILL